MTSIEYPRQSFDKMSRKQAITTCYALEDMRDRAVAEVERLNRVARVMIALRISHDAEVDRLWGVIEANGATNSRLMRERDEARATIDRLRGGREMEKKGRRE